MAPTENLLPKNLTDLLLRDPVFFNIILATTQVLPSIISHVVGAFLILGVSETLASALIASTNHSEIPMMSSGTNQLLSTPQVQVWYNPLLGGSQRPFGILHSLRTQRPSTLSSGHSFSA